MSVIDFPADAEEMLGAQVTVSDNMSQDVLFDVSDVDDPEIRKELSACASDRLDCVADITGVVELTQETQGGDVATEPALAAKLVAFADARRFPN